MQLVIFIRRNTIQRQLYLLRVQNLQVLHRTGPAKRLFSGRLVLTHTTHCDLLIAILSKLAHVDGIRSIVPGRLATARGNSEQLVIRVTVPLQNGFKLVARKGTQVQEVFVVTRLGSDDLQREIDNLLQLR